MIQVKVPAATGQQIMFAPALDPLLQAIQVLFCIQSRQEEGAAELKRSPVVLSNKRAQ